MMTLEKAGIVPGVIGPVPEATKARVTYGGSAVNPGEIRKPADARTKPQVAWPQKHGELYSVIMFDPDVPSRRLPVLGSWLHWWAGNISPERARRPSIIKAYTGPSPPPGTGYHRYIFLVCRQASGEIKPFVPFRGRFGIRERLKMHDLQVVAINFFYARRGWPTEDGADITWGHSS